MNFLNDKHMENFKNILMEDNTNPRDVERQSFQIEGMIPSYPN